MNALREALLRGKRRPRLSGAGSPTLFRGDGYEFVELRAYAPGDDVRRIDWAATARSAQLQTRVILEDVALTLAVLLDTSPSMQAGRRRPLLAAAREALDTWFGAAISGDRRVQIFSDEALAYPMASNAPFSLKDALNVAAAVLSRGTALLAIGDFWDMPEDDDAIVFLGRRFDCTALIARDPWFDELPLRGFVRIADAESARSQLLYIGAREARKYVAAVREREEQLIERFRRANWRTGAFGEEEDGGAALMHAFGVR